MTKNIDQSVKDRLKNLARSSGRDYNFVCIQYKHERFLARLSPLILKSYQFSTDN
jgi:hypothetical protein